MNIKQAEELSGVSRQNIRFYEREGLLSPDRNPDNDYREYTDEHIRILKQIRILRMLDMSLEKIRLILNGELTLSQAVQEQENVLKQQQEQLTAAIRFCEELKASSLAELNADAVLERMNHPENQEGFFRQWLCDYRKVVLSEREKTFSFVPDEAVTTAAEFTAALFRFANENNLDLVMTREGMYPEFTINGIEYTAERFYKSVQRIPTAVIRCTVKYPEDFEPDVPEGRKKYMKLLNLSWAAIPFALILLVLILTGSAAAIFSSWEGWVLLASFIVLILANLYLHKIFHFNEKQ